MSGERRKGTTSLAGCKSHFLSLSCSFLTRCKARVLAVNQTPARAALPRQPPVSKVFFFLNRERRCRSISVAPTCVIELIAVTLGCCLQIRGSRDSSGGASAVWASTKRRRRRNDTTEASKGFVTSIGGTRESRRFPTRFHRQDDDAAAAVKSGKSGSKQHDLPTGEKHNEIRVSTLSSLCINISSDCYRYFSFLSLFFQSIIAAHI